ncbi:chaperone modulator CbpM [Legionella waltersii]|uniref:Putative chaperone-modulator protein CbpM n=1 Tax=Legionella waltersii TaxID=66969 RepID=A0A0W1A0W2_9GAMM|nr:chaperone modulator CbpM [Legionella waltersii]KTD74691.1 putative chaperone-modulator protein CbpM [Legionella waltersii]SNV09247.1 putative chaperone-modulator protein CbpM [Legionella waltersii]
MNKDKLIVGVVIEETTTYTFVEICQKYQIPEELLIEMIEQGFFPEQSTNPNELKVNQKSLQRIESAFRLHRDLGINLPGVTLALDLLDEIEKMRKELDILRKHF